MGNTTGAAAGFCREAGVGFRLRLWVALSLRRGAVSYTHLDVYKRQAVSTVAHTDHNKFDAGIFDGLPVCHPVIIGNIDAIHRPGAYNFLWRERGERAVFFL